MFSESDPTLTKFAAALVDILSTHSMLTLSQKCSGAFKVRKLLPQGACMAATIFVYLRDCNRWPSGEAASQRHHRGATHGDSRWAGGELLHHLRHAVPIQFLVPPCFKNRHWSGVPQNVRPQWNDVQCQSYCVESSRDSVVPSSQFPAVQAVAQFDRSWGAGSAQNLARNAATPHSALRRERCVVTSSRFNLPAYCQKQRIKWFYWSVGLSLVFCLIGANHYVDKQEILFSDVQVISSVGV